jgi:hypothetical protein
MSAVTFLATALPGRPPALRQRRYRPPHPHHHTKRHLQVPYAQIAELVTNGVLIVSSSA